MKKHLYFATFVSALGGFLFGFDTAVISGTTRFITDTFDLTNVSLGFTVSIALVGTILGSLLVGRPCDVYGRNRMLSVTAVLYFICGVGCGLAPNWYVLLFSRFLGGLAVGAASVVAPMYIAEIAPAESRGRLVAVSQLNIVLGILAAFFSNTLLVGAGPDNWRWMFGVQALPAAVFFILIFFIPSSPRWLVKRNRIDEAGEVLRKVGGRDVPKQLAEIVESLKEEVGRGKPRLFQRRYRFHIMAAVMLAVFNQLTGINVIMYYAPMIFEKTGLSTDAAVQQALVIGLTNFIFTIIAMSVIDRLGRKTLLLIGSVGMSAALALVGRAFYTREFNGPGILIYLVAYIAFFAFSQGAVIWVFLSEIFPNRIRAQGQALGSFTHWIMNAFISFAFPTVLATLGGGNTFLFYSLMMIVQFFFVWKVLPETKGVSLEELERKLAGR
jgi:MFS transporter, SP family, xylose:H+ symportor